MVFTTLPAPITTLSPIVTPGSTHTFPPIHTLFLTVIGLAYSNPLFLVSASNGYYPERTVATEMGEMPVKVPRDRNGEIDSKLVPKYSRIVNGFDEKIISMYALRNV